MMKRREFLEKSVLAGGVAFLRRIPLSLKSQGVSIAAPWAESEPRISFQTSDSRYQTAYSRALDVLARNTTAVRGYREPVLTEGSSYKGIWLECAPHEGLVYSFIRPDVARSNHLSFFAEQREDGQIPCWIRTTATGFGQIQMVVPIAATAWELSQQTGDSELIEKAYRSCGRWDAWLRRYRDTRRTGLCEGFCTYDTGHDNSPRWAGIPNRCPDADARKCPPLASLPRLSPDLSATVYGGRVALAAMARALGTSSEADRWLDDAAAIRSAILEKLYSAADAAFYDLDAQNRFVRIRGDVISRVLGEHVVDQTLFETIYECQIHNPAAFWAPFPLPSIALDDPAFIRPITPNSWGGASQALTALRAPRWMEHYSKPADLAHLMQQWVSAILQENKFLQQMDPVDGKFTADTGDYSPAGLLFIDFTWRLAGVRRIENTLEWNVRPSPNVIHSSYRLKVVPTLTAEIRYSSGQADLLLNDKPFCSTNNVARVITDLDGSLRSATGIGSETISVVLRHVSGQKQRFSLEPNGTIKL
jgi:hypothetical protein